MSDSLFSQWGIPVEMQAETVKRFREWMGLNQEQLATALGVARMTVVRWETRLTTPSIDDLKALGEVFAPVVTDTLVEMKREIREQMGLPADIPAFDHFVETMRFRVRLLTFAMLGAGRTVMPAALWSELLDLEPSILKDVPGEPPADPFSSTVDGGWRVKLVAEPAPPEEARMLTGVSVAIALDGALRGRSFSATVPENPHLREALAKGWVKRLTNELDDRLRRYAIDAGSPFLWSGDKALDALDEKRVLEAIRLERERRQKKAAEASTIGKAPRTAARRQKKRTGR